MLADIPKWYMKEEYRSFDHIHPNNRGHKVIADTICPKLPDSWGCKCD
jgi:lysophospholipase L1-like esterase